MKDIIEARRKNWKEYLISLLKKAEHPHDFMRAFVYYYLFYTKGTRELHKRLVGMLHRMDDEMKNISGARKGDFDFNWLKKADGILKNTKSELEKSRD